jgi:hypothetical protein
MPYPWGHWARDYGMINHTGSKSRSVQIIEILSSILESENRNAFNKRRDILKGLSLTMKIFLQFLNLFSRKQKSESEIIPYRWTTGRGITVIGLNVITNLLTDLSSTHSWLI